MLVRILNKMLLILALLLLFTPAQSQAANKMWWATCLTESSTCLDGIDGALLTAGDGALVVWDSGSTIPNLYIYRLYESGTTESYPSVISPDTNAGNKRWHLTTLVGRNFKTGQVAATIPSISLDHTGEAGAQSSIIFLDDGAQKFRLIYDIANDGTPTFTIYDDVTPASRVTVTTAGVNVAGALTLNSVTVPTIGTSTPFTASNGGNAVAPRGYYVVTGTTALVLPTAVAGYEFCIAQDVGGSSVITLSPPTSGYLGNQANSAYCTQNYRLVSGGAATDKICVVGRSTTQYMVLSAVGTWTCTAPP
jgi:hypothetical protein